MRLSGLDPTAANGDFEPERRSRGVLTFPSLALPAGDIDSGKPPPIEMTPPSDEEIVASEACRGTAIATLPP